jgi:hypothetical protein
VKNEAPRKLCAQFRSVGFFVGWNKMTGAQALREGFAEIMSGWSRQRQGLVATCRDSSNEAAREGGEGRLWSYEADNAEAEQNSELRSFSRHFAMICSKSRGTSGLSRTGGTAVRFMIPSKITPVLSPRNGNVPVAISYRTAPNEKKSVRASNSLRKFFLFKVSFI